MKALISAAAIMLLAALLQSCVLSTVREAISAGQKPTPEEVEAWQKAGHQVYLCFNISGPPPSGGYSMLVLPGNAVPTINFAPNCSLIQGVVQ